MQRTALLAELVCIESPSVVTFCAPPGFGKSTVLSQWAAIDARPFPWLTLTEAHRDRAKLLSDLDVLTAPLRSGPATGLRLLPDIAASVPVHSPVSAEEIVGQLAGPFVLVLDDAHVLGEWLVVDELIAAMPNDSLLVIASRRAVPVRTRSMLQLTGVEFTDRDLAFDQREIRLAVGPSAGPAVVKAVLDGTQGWPLAVTLNVINAASQTSLRRSRQTGDDQKFQDYLRTEMLSGLDEATRTFLTRASVLDQLSGALCDVVTGGTGGGQLLQGRLSDDLLVAPLTGLSRQYRCHPLLRRALADDLRLRAPDLIPELHIRAARWFATHGQLDAAIGHAKQSGDIPVLAGLIWPNIQHAIADGGISRLRSWLSDLTNDQIRGSADLIVAAAWLSMLDGRLEDVVTWQALAEAREGRQWRADIGRSERRAVLALLRAWRGASGPDDVYEDSSAAFHALPADSPWRPVAGALSGIMLIWSGRDLEGRSRLTASEELARALGVPTAQADCLAALGCLAFDDGDLPLSQRLILRAWTALQDHELTGSPTSAFAASVLAVGLARAGRSADAAAKLAHAVRLTDALDGFAPWMMVHTRILQIDTCLLVGDIGTTRHLLRRIQDLIRRQGLSRDLSSGQQANLRRAELLLAQLPVDPIYGSLPLTQAEFRIAQLLPTHLSFPEIGTLLFNSRHTVKTQALAVYRKLGATSRSEAVDRLRVLGYLPPAAVPDSLVLINAVGSPSAAPGPRYALVASRSAARAEQGRAAESPG